jgi:hypothetical protein
MNGIQTRNIEGNCGHFCAVYAIPLEVQMRAAIKKAVYHYRKIQCSSFAQYNRRTFASLDHIGRADVANSQLKSELGSSCPREKRHHQQMTIV